MRERPRQSAGRRRRVELLEARQLFSAGSLDTSFGGTGVVQWSIPNGVVYEDAVAVQSDQKIVTAAVVLAPGSGGPELARYNPDGSLDPTFGTNGISDALVEPIRSISQEVIAPDGQIVIAGQYATGTQSLYGGFIARFNADGTLDNSFGDGGFVTASEGDGTDAGITGLSVQPDGKIVAAVGGTTNEFTLARYNADGTPDTSFGTGGIVQSPAPNAQPGSLALESDGDIVLSGSSTAGLTVLQFDDSGNELGSFSTLILQGDRAAGLLLQNGGSIVVSGTAFDSSDDDFPFVAQLTGALSLDTSFGENGVSVLNQTGHNLGLVEQPNGKYVLGFAALVSSGQSKAIEFGLARLNSDGSLDTSYGTGGLVLAPVGNNPAGIAIQQDGNLLFVGASTTDYDDGVGIVARFLGDPVGVNQPPTFLKGPDQSLPENAGSQAVSGWATGISTGAADEVGQTLDFLVQTTNSSLFAVPPAVTPSGTLTYTPAAGAVGAALVTVALQNSGGTAGGGSDTSATQSFIINVGSMTPWQNPISTDDVNGDDVVSPLDALVIINELNANGAARLGVASQSAERARRLPGRQW